MAPSTGFQLSVGPLETDDESEGLERLGEDIAKTDFGNKNATKIKNKVILKVFSTMCGQWQDNNTNRSNKSSPN